MPAEIVNLNRFRKTKARDDKAREAAENRIKFGRTKAEKQQVAAQEQLDARRLDGVKRTEPASEPEGE
jgi:Domain of unknown function (DUF4169)